MLTKEVLESTVKNSKSLTEVLKKLNLSIFSHSRKKLKIMLKDFDISFSHFNKSKYTKDTLEPIVKNSFSLSEVLRKLNLKITGGNFRMINSKLKEFNISKEHFKKTWNEKFLEYSSNRKRKDEDVFIVNSPEFRGERLAKRLLKLGWKYVCSLCGITSWRDKTLRLEVDHINGIPDDNRFCNLRFLCPNCHSQTETYNGKNRIK